MGPSLSWSFVSWIYNYLWNQYLSPLTLWVRTQFWRGALDTTLCDKVCQWLAAGRWFSPGISLSSTNKTDCHDIAEILLKVALNTITLTFNCQNIISDNWPLPMKNTTQILLYWNFFVFHVILSPWQLTIIINNTFLCIWKQFYLFRTTILPPVDTLKQMLERFQKYHNQFLSTYK